MKISGRTAIGLMSLLRRRELPQIYLLASDSNLGSPRVFVAIYTFKPGPIAFRPPTIAHVLLMGACPQIASAIVNGVPIDVVYQLVRISAKNQTMHTLLADARNKPNYIPAIIDVPRKPAYLLEVVGIDLRISVVREQKHGIPGNKKSRADGIRTRFSNIGGTNAKARSVAGFSQVQLVTS
jgi:hypothetical protein